MFSAVPDKPNISYVKREHDKLTIHWSYDHDGGKPVKSITIKYQKNIDNTWNKIQVSGPLKQCTIPTLQPETIYIFKVAIRNEIGESEFSDPYKAKTTKKGINPFSPNAPFHYLPEKHQKTVRVKVSFSLLLLFIFLLLCVFVRVFFCFCFLFLFLRVM